MSFPLWLTVAALAMLPLASSAQRVQQFDPADANAPVPATGYVSAFENYHAAADEKASPDHVWRAANAAVQSEDMPGKNSNDASRGNTQPEANTPNDQQGQQQQAAPKADPHASHDGHTSEGK